jgi:hypothetical protein
MMVFPSSADRASFRYSSFDRGSAAIPASLISAPWMNRLSRAVD